MTATEDGVIRPPAASATSDPRAPVSEELRRQVSVLFCDLVGSTALSSRLDPEDLHELLARYHGAAVQAVERLGGRFHHTYGDGLMVSWGYPQAREDDAVRAVMAGLDILVALRRLNDELAQSPPLSARVAVHTGLAVIADRRLGDQHEVANLIGVTPNLAARLQSVAAPDSVVISDATEDLLHGRFALEPLGPQHLAGVDRPVEAFRVLGATEGARAAGTPEQTMIGRRYECGVVTAAWHSAGRGSGRVVSLHGEPGIGKSLLARHALRLAADAGLPPVVLHCSSWHTASVLHPVRRALEQVLGVGPSSSESDRRSRLRALAAGSHLGREDTALLAALVAVSPGPGVDPVTLPPEPRRERTFALLLRLLTGLGTGERRLLLVEDLHWSDPSTLELVRRVAADPPPGLLAVLTSRDSLDHVAPAATRLELAPLSDEEIGAVVRAVEPAADDAVVRTVVQRADGVPLYAAELARYLRRTGPVAPEDVPPRLQDLLVARLDQHPDERSLAQVLATIGVVAPRSLVERVDGSPVDDVRHALGRLVEAGVLRDEGPAHDPFYRFHHVLLRDAAYTTATRSRRRRLHARVADALRQAPVGAVAPGSVAHHLEESGQRRESTLWWRRAAAAAAEVAAHREVVDHLRHVLALLQEAPDEAGPDPATVDAAVDVVEVLGALSVSLAALQGYTSDEVARVHQRASTLLAERPHQRATAGAVYPLWAYRHVRGELDESTALARRLYTETGAQRGPQRAMAAAMLGFDLVERGLLGEALPVLDVAAEQAVEPLPDIPHELWSAVGVLAGVVLWTSGERPAGERRVAEAVARAEALGPPKGPFTLAFVHSYAAWWRLLCDDAEGALASANRSIEVASSGGYATWIAASTAHAAAAWARTGAPERAVGVLEQVLSGWRAAGAETFRPVFLRWLAEARSLSGEHEAALAVLLEAVDHARRFGGRQHEPELLRLAGRELRHLGRREGAVASFRAAADLASALGAASFELRARCDLVETLAGAAAAAERPALAAVLGRLPAGCTDADVQRARSAAGSSLVGGRA